MGWPEPDFGTAEVQVSPSSAERRSLAERTRSARAHIFAGLGSRPVITRSMVELAKKEHGHIAVVSESWESGGPRGNVRDLIYAYRTFRHKQHVDSILAIGEQAYKQFEHSGFERNQIHRFGYFVTDSGTSIGVPADARGPVNIVFAGDLVPWKNPKLLVTALGQLDQSNWRLQIVGEGPLRSALEDACKEHGLANKVDFIGFMPNADLRRLISSSDLLVLPSLYDGWGAVVNEALQAGTRVCVSDAAGSSALVSSLAQGWTFPSADIHELVSALRQAIEDGPTQAIDRASLIDWARGAISPQAGAEYLWSIVNSGTLESQPLDPPWNTQVGK